MDTEKFQESGLFWWDKKDGNDNDFIPQHAIAGDLSIDGKGSAFLALHGMLNESESEFSTFHNDPIDESSAIFGILKTSSNKVRLSIIHRSNTSQSFGTGFSHESYYAQRCLIISGVSENEDKTNYESYEEMEIPINGLKEWVTPFKRRAKTRDRTFVSTLELPDDATYEIQDGKISIKYSYRISYSSQAISTIENTSIVFQPNHSLSVESFLKRYRDIENILILVTGLDLVLQWPILKSGRVSSQVYFRRFSSATKSIDWTECFLTYKNISNSFDKIFRKWLEQYQKSAPGLYLFLATKRGRSLFAEHTFVSLIWGIESLHRNENTDITTPALQAKIDRILNAVEAKDRRWLAGKLAHAAEPSLSDRIFEVLKSSEITIEEKSLRAFSNVCASARNELSHFGGARDNEKKDLLRTLTEITPALSFLYQISLLSKIGASAEILNDAVTTGPMAYRFNQACDLAKIHVVHSDLIQKSPPVDAEDH